MSKKYTKEKLAEAVKSAACWADVCRSFDVKPLTGSQTYLTNVAKKFDLDTSHFTGSGWRAGKTFDRERKPASYYLEKDGKFINNSALKRKLIEEGLKEEICEGCRLTEWLEKPIPLELDHINGDNKDNRLQNLRLLCPNCHALTPTYCRRK